MTLGTPFLRLISTREGEAREQFQRDAKFAELIDQVLFPIH